jgi:hypothetical protein
MSHDPDIGFVAPIITEAIEAEAIIETAEKRDVVLQRDVRAPSAAASATAAHTAAASGAHASTAPHAATANGAHASAANTCSSTPRRPVRDPWLGGPASCGRRFGRFPAVGRLGRVPGGLLEAMQA